MPTISSRSNEKIKHLRALRHHKVRKETQEFLVEGIHHVGEAVEAGAPIRAIFYAPDLLTSAFAARLIQTQESKGTPCFKTSRDVFQSIAAKENPQGILAVVEEPQYSLSDFSPANFAWAVALVQPQNPGNIGTILRTIDAAGASGLILLDGGADPYHPKAVRASMGTLFWYPVIRTTFEYFLTWAADHRYHIIGSSAHGDTDYQSVGHYPLPRILLMGSEQKGLTQSQMEACEATIRIPMVGRASSLNLAVSTGILIYAMLSKS